jgi:hypothetical protein
MECATSVCGKIRNYSSKGFPKMIFYVPGSLKEGADVGGWFAAVEI